MDIAVLGIDLGKNVCSVVGLDDGGRVLVRRRLKRPAVIEFAGQSPGSWWQWKRAAERIIWRVSSRPRGTRSD